MQLYLPDYNDILFWGDPRSPTISTEGMDWFVWAGRTNNNFYTGQQNLFNRIDRPLNHYGLNYAVVTCPLDQGRTESQPYKNMEWVGNSYLFNCFGLPPGATGGLDGQRATAVTQPTRTVLFADCILALPTEPYGWHATQTRWERGSPGRPHRAPHGNQRNQYVLVTAVAPLAQLELRKPPASASADSPEAARVRRLTSAATVSARCQGLRQRGFPNELESLGDEDIAGALTQAGPRDIGIPLEAVIIFLGQDVAKRIIGQAKEQIVLAAHLALQVVADVGQGFARDGEDLGVAEVDQVQLGGHARRIPAGAAGQRLSSARINGSPPAATRDAPRSRAWATPAPARR